jgi:hypothetical protein
MSALFKRFVKGDGLLVNEHVSIGLPEAIDSFLTKEERFSLEKTLRERTRASLLTERYFIKAGFSTEGRRFQSLQNEINVYTDFCFPDVKYPRLKWHHIDTHLVILLIERIQAFALAERRDAFTLPPHAHVEAVLDEISQLKAAKIPHNWHARYHRDENVEKYIKAVSPYIPENTRCSLDSLAGNLHTNENLVFSHGDLLPMNIMANKEHYWLVDWEYADIRPTSFDPAYFLLFSHHPSDGIKLFEKRYRFWDPVELYRDTVVISLHEMKLWITQVEPGSLQTERITMWQHVLEECVRWLMSH